MGLIETYLERIRSGELRPDESQAEIALKLSRLADELDANPLAKTAFLPRFLQRWKPVPRGVYLYGPVGRGKSMLMDMFCESVRAWPKRRVHFHAFMQDIHARRASLPGGDVIGQIARRLANEARLLCLDEMQIVDIADAMIIGRLFDALHREGVVIVTTSNLPPDALYRNGLNRQLFLPFIARIQTAMDVVALDDHHDYRLGRVRARETYVQPLGPDADAKLDKLWRILTDDAAGDATELAVLGRKIIVPRSAHGCARFSFADLCGAALGSADYIAIAKAFRTVFIDGIPKLKSHQRNEARRFVLMIDTFYDAQTRLVASADAAPESICPKNLHGLEFARTISRLKEMQSASWWGVTLAET